MPISSVESVGAESHHIQLELSVCHFPTVVGKILLDGVLKGLSVKLNFKNTGRVRSH